MGAPHLNPGEGMIGNLIMAMIVEVMPNVWTQIAK
jgi:hypothetical protein